MKPNIFIYLILLLGGISLTSCNPDNFDDIIEEEFPFNPTEIEENDSKFSYSLQGSTKNYAAGYGKEVLEDFYVLASDSVFCDGNGGYSTRAQSDTGFFISFFQFSPNNFGLAQAVLRREINGDTVAVFSGTFVLNCTNDPVITIRNRTASSIEGTYEAEFFSLPDPSQDPNDCNNWQSVGTLLADFIVPVDSCF
ncbi:MAG: hypothetical protein AAFR87_14100 [Bacteroidota bacterium]